MKSAEKSLKCLLGALLLGLAAHTLAASLGRVRGAAIVGHPLDVTLSAQLDGTENPSSVCLSAEVFFGDSQISPDKVRTSISPGAGAGEVLVRIRTTVVLDEPVVMLYAREGCQQKNSRKYVLLAEMLGDNSVPVPSTLAQAPAAAAASTAALSQAGTSKAKPQTRTGTGTAMASSLGMPPARTAGKQTPKQAPTPAPARKSGPRLQLAPIDLAAERDPVLRASPELLTLPSADAQQRASAAALWQALNAQPQDMARDSQRLKSLESDVAAMLAQSRKTELAVTDLRGQLEQARQERYSNWLVYALGTILLLALLAAGFFWRRDRQRALRLDHWWDKEAAQGKPSGFSDETGPASRSAGLAPAPVSAVDLDLDALQFESTRKLPASRPVEPVDRPEFLPSLGGLSGMPRIVNAEELFDVQQQADFFVSLGHPDKAVDVLRLHIMDNVETSALVYLDLFDLYHSLGRKDDYDALRKDFHRMFNAQVPAFDDYAMDTHGLEFYVAALTRIESLWPTPKVLDVLEESIFRKPDSRSEVFSLAAYRELLLLHSIAKKIVTRPVEAGEGAGAPAPGMPSLAVALPQASSFGPTNILPLSARLQETPPPLPVALPVAGAGAFPTEIAPSLDLTRPPVSPRLGLDIDLSQEEADDALAPLPAIAMMDIPPEAGDFSNLIEFDLDVPASRPDPKA
ncbi:hypothetical protein ACEN8I_20490 [Polaromonas sp. CT11-55]|uniref:hypothetical protein n=1 Tax=Polaromonas sp. CT11-55 TaxID=3243045 RepID=UPI0039A540C6